MKRHIVLSAAALWVVAQTALGAEPAAPKDAAEIQAPAATPGMAGRRVVRDRDSGELRAPTAGELQSQGQDKVTSRRGGRAVESRVHAEGMRSAVPGADYLVTLRAQRLPDGSVVIRHSDGEHKNQASRPGTEQQATE